MLDTSNSGWWTNNLMRARQSRRWTSFIFIAVAAYLVYSNWSSHSDHGSWVPRPTTSRSISSEEHQDTSWMRGEDLYSKYESNPTTYVAGVPGYNLFRNLFLFKGVLYAVNEDDSVFPAVASLLSAKPDDTTGKREPAGEDKYRVVTIKQAQEIFGDRISVRVGGTTIFFNDQESGPPRNMSSFLNHYFHLIAESFVGAWRLLSTVYAQESGSNSVHGMSFPARFVFAHAEPNQWRDHAGLSTWFLNTILPMTAIEEFTVFEDRKQSETVHVFEQIVLLDRFSATRSSPLARAWNKMAAELPNIDAPADWWFPIRSNLFHAIGAPEMLLGRNREAKAVVTYVSRQSAKHRKMFPADDKNVVAQLQKLSDAGEIEFVHAIMEHISRPDQLLLAARTDILVGIHGNGLSHQMWQRPGSDVIEIMDAGGFTRDYEILSELMSHDHYTVHNDVLFSRHQWYIDEKKWKIVEQTRDFHGDNIRCNGEFVAEVVQGIVERKYKAS